MFGLLKPLPFNLPLVGNATWSSVVCSTCVHLGNKFGSLARFTTGPDTAVLAALYEAQTGGEAATSVHYCPLRMGSARLWRGDHPGVRFAGAISLLAASARLEDHLQDGDSLPVPRCVAHRLARQWAAAAHEAAAALDFDTHPLWQQINSQRQRERQLDQPLAYYAEPTAFCFGEAFAHTARLSQRPENIAALRQVGRAFGQQVFLLDAVDDFAEDERRGRFNPLRGYGTVDAATQAAAEWVEQAQHAVEVHLAEVTMARPEWVRPVLADALRQIGRHRLRCASSCTTAGSCSSPKKNPGDEKTADKGSRRFLTFCLTTVGTVLGLMCGSCCAHGGLSSRGGSTNDKSDIPPSCCCEDCHRCFLEKCCAPCYEQLCSKCCNDCCKC